ncbi:uncharacterized protein LOC126907501 [Daktulosphaira vitifoliae]|uniref:uncharacterized protein LOC126907501 n=1 Tax=Daktulosphaira vitifoliae TaxID=58002 RepID=UPI0021AA1D1B|nr:uncharacterized protein LOC126907501 [Daktulosphaira vitifoliae]
MSRKCSVRNCKSFDGLCTFFSVPKASLSSWTNIIEKVNGSTTQVKFVCEKHFLSQDLINSYIETDQFSDIKDFPQPLRPRLKKGAIPQIFFKNEVEASQVLNESSQCYFNLKSIQNNVKLPNGWHSFRDADALTFINIQHDKTTSFIKAIIRKQIVITSDKTIRIHILDKIFTEEDLLVPKISSFSYQEVNKLILCIDSKNICIGGPNVLNYPGIDIKYGVKINNNIWRHKKCNFVLHKLSIKRCLWCKKLCAAFRIKKYQNLKKSVENNVDGK